MTWLDVTLMRPFWLLALVPLVMSGWWLWTRQGGLGAWERVANPALLRALSDLGRVEAGRDRMPILAALSAAGLGILALSGPAVERRDAVSFRNLDGVVFVLDASRSVMEDPRWPQVQTMGRFAISALGSRPAGLVVFAGDAYIATGMTGDVRQLGQTFSLIDKDTVPDAGSRPARGLALAAQMLDTSDVIAGDVILLTDGAGLGPDTLGQAAQIAGQGARLSIVTTTPTSPLLETHVADGKGQLFTLSQTDELVAWMQAEARTRLERQDMPMLFWRDLGRYVLLFALAPLLLLFRRSAA